MATEPTPAPAERVSGAARRTAGAWRALSREQRFAAAAAIGLFFSMFLPWYEKSAVPKGGGGFKHDNLSAFGAFSFVEAAVLLVSLGVLAILFARGEGRAFHLPGGDGTVITVAGGWACLLIIWRLFDTPSASGGGATVGLQWGIFGALAVAAALAYAGNRLRTVHPTEPPLPTERPEAQPEDVRIPEERPHLAQTRVMPDRRPAPPLPQDPPPERTREPSSERPQQPRIPGMPE